MTNKLPENIYKIYFRKQGTYSSKMEEYDSLAEVLEALNNSEDGFTDVREYIESNGKPIGADGLALFKDAFGCRGIDGNGEVTWEDAPGFHALLDELRGNLSTNLLVP